MKRRRKLWNRQPRSKFEAWLQDIRDRYNIGLFLFALLLAVAGKWLLAAMNEPHSMPIGMDVHDGGIPSPEASDSIALQALLSNQEDLEDIKMATVSIPGLGDGITVIVHHAGAAGMTDAQKKAYDEFTRRFATDAESFFNAMAANRNKVAARAADTMRRYMDAVGDRLGYVPEVASGRDLAGLVRHAVLAISPNPKDDAALIFLTLGGDPLIPHAFHGGVLITEEELADYMKHMVMDDQTD